MDDSGNIVDVNYRIFFHLINDFMIVANTTIQPYHVDSSSGNHDFNWSITRRNVFSNNYSS